MTQDKDNQVKNPTEPEDKGSDTASHDAGTAKGEEAAAKQGGETGVEAAEQGEDRGHEVRTARSATSVNPENQEPIDPEMPHMPPA